MFPGSSSLGESVAELFSPAQNAQAQYYKQLLSQSRVDRASSGAQNQGVKDMPGLNGAEASRNSPQYGNEKNRPAATEDPANVEAAWMARMAKFAGIAQSTGVKI